MGPRVALFFLACASVHAQGIISTVAGNGAIGNSGNGGAATSASLGNVVGLAVDKAGNLYIADGFYNVVRKVNSAGIISTIAGGGSPASLGDGGPATSARLVLTGLHVGMAVDAAGNLYITDSGDSRIRKIDTSGNISTVAGNSTSLGLGGFSGDGGPATSATLNTPTGLAFDSAGNMYISDYGNLRIRKVDTSGTITTIAGIGNPGGSDAGDGGPATSAQLSGTLDVAVDPKGNVFIADLEHIREVAPSGVISTAAHGFFGTCAANPTPVASADVAANGLATDGSGNLFIADKSAGCIQELETNGMVSTVAGGGLTMGDGIVATQALLSSPVAVAVDASGNFYIAVASVVRKVSATGVAPSAKPAISSQGVLNGGSFVSGISPNSWVTIQGTNLSAKTDVWTVSGGVLPTSLDGVSVTIDGLPAFVYYVSPTQINVLSPVNLTNQFPQVVVTNSAGASAPATVFSQPQMPAFFTWPNNQVVATHADFTFAAKNGTFAGLTTVPAKPGETIILWGTGFGASNPVAPNGMTVPATATYSLPKLPTVELNQTQATVYGAALAPGFAGLWQLAFQVPAAMPNGDTQVFAVISGTPGTNVPTLTVHN